MLQIFQALTIIALAFVALSARAQNDEAEFSPDPRSVRIESFSHSGTGCPAGSVVGDISPDNQVITILFSQYSVEKRASEQAGAKNCNMRFRLAAPAGWSHAVMSMSVQGFADLEAGLSGFQGLSYGYADGTGRNKLGRMTIEGPYTNDYNRVEEIPLSSLDWSRCDKATNDVVIQSNIGIRAAGPAGRTAVGLMTTDVIENVLDQGVSGKMNQQFAVLWKKCPAGGGAGGVKKAGLAVCKISISERASGKLLKQVSVRARAKTSAMALQKAQRKAQQRCAAVQNGGGRGRGGVAKSCQWSASQCSSVEL